MIVAAFVLTIGDGACSFLIRVARACLDESIPGIAGDDEDFLIFLLRYDGFPLLSDACLILIGLRVAASILILNVGLFVVLLVMVISIDIWLMRVLLLLLVIRVMKVNSSL